MTKPFLITLLLALAVPVIKAETWTYQGCVDYALEHNISLQKTRLGEQTADVDLDEAKAQWQPTLDFATSHGYTNSPWSHGNKNAYNSSYGFNAGWTVWDGGSRKASIRRDELQTSIARLATDEATRSLRTDILQVYLNILYAKEAIAIYEDAASLSKAQAERARQLMEAGRVSRVDYARLQSQYEQDNYALVNARCTYDTRCMELKQLLELGPDNDISLTDVEITASQVLAELPPLDESCLLAAQTDVRIKSLEVEKNISAEDVTIAKSGSMPKVSLNAGIGTGYYAPGEAFGTQLKRAWSEQIGLTLAVPILDGKKTKSAVARAKIQQLDAQLDIEKRDNELALAVENWYIDTRSAQSRYTAAIQQLESARLTDELTNEQFALGYINTVELMTAHNGFIEAQHTLLQAKYMAMLGHKMIEYYRTANITL